MTLLKNLLIYSCSLLRINLLAIAYKGIGIAPEYHSLSDSFFKKLLPQYLKQGKRLVFFDVGANIGEVTNLMLQFFPQAEIHAFEPNPHTFKKLMDGARSLNLTLNNFGLSEKQGASSIFYYKNDASTGHASIFKNVFDLHDAGPLDESPIMLATLDNYCAEKKIDHINFLKIDTEGNDYFALKGASNMLRQGNIDVIQFEFNEMNVISKVFLKDFYDLLKDYSLYRIKGDRLFPLGAYSSTNEIFKLQNILAIKGDRQ